MPTFPTAEVVARQFLLYKLGKALKTSYEDIASKPKLSWPVVLLDNSDVQFLAGLGVTWDAQPRNNKIITLLGKHFADMNKHDVSLELEAEVQHLQSIVFVSLRK